MGEEDLTVSELAMSISRVAIKVIMLGRLLEELRPRRPKKDDIPKPKIPYIRYDSSLRTVYYPTKHMSMIYRPPRHIPRLENEFE